MKLTYELFPDFDKKADKAKEFSKWHLLQLTLMNM